MMDLDPTVRAQLTAIIAARWRLLLLVMSGGIGGMTLTNWLLVPDFPRYAVVLQAAGAGVALLGARLMRSGRLAARPVPLGLALLAIAAVQRSIIGPLTHDVAATAILGAGVVLTIAAAVPWGLRPQLAAVAIGAAGYAANELLVGGTLAALGPAAGALATAFGLSLLIAHKVEQTHVDMLAEGARRRRSEAALTRLNDELEARVRERTAELEAVIDNSRDAIFSIDRAGTVLVMNAEARRRFARRHGHPFDPGRPNGGATPEVRAAFQPYYDRAFAGEHVEVEHRFDRDEGPETYLVAVHPIRHGAEVVGATVFSRDMTARLRAEEQARRHQAELAHVLRLGTMGEMAAGLAHEINQPLGAIANYALGAAQRLRGDAAIDRPALRDVVERIGAEALRAGHIIRRLRELLHKELPAPQAVDVNEVATASAHVVEGESRRQGVAVELQLGASLPRVLADPIQLEQVLLNLLLNGIEATAAAGGDGRITVRTAAVAAGVELTVSDTGIGLPPPPADVFEPFFTTKARGLGMGLSISRSIVELHGGRLDARPNPDRGSTFRLVLPAHVEAPACSA